ncbi:MAG: hypothetical protein IJL72_05295 [Lachnospiraceae bacterium]|nr:hypothetical protein [Lachnospiraceae bacterium]
MRKIRLADTTMKQRSSASLTFKEKIELVRILDRLSVDVIETDEIRKIKADSLCIKSISDAVTGAIVAVPVQPDKASIDTAWEALQRARHPRLQIVTPVSLVQMEYLMHKKPEAVRESALSAVRYAKTLCPEVELVLLDATRSERPFLIDLMKAAAEEGADVICACDLAGLLLPREAGAFVAEILAEVPAFASSVTLAVSFADTLSLANACMIEAVRAGAGEIKTAIHATETASAGDLARILSQRGEALEAESGVRVVEAKRSEEQAWSLFHAKKSATSPFEDGVAEAGSDTFSIRDDFAAIKKETRRLGYDLSEDDALSVYEAFRRIASKKESVTSREIDAIVASEAMQVPAAYEIEDFIINSGQSFGATAHIKLRKHGELLEGVAIGDGPVDASILAIERIIGRHYELDDFQVQSVTEGREAMGETIIKLRSEGQVYSGRGISTDIVGSAVRAYVNALNKIVYEEENA